MRTDTVRYTAQDPFDLLDRLRAYLRASLESARAYEVEIGPLQLLQPRLPSADGSLYGRVADVAADVEAIAHIREVRANDEPKRAIPRPLASKVAGALERR